MKNRRLIIIAILAILLLLVCCALVYVWIKSEPEPENSKGGVLFEDPSAVNIADKPINTGISADSISIPGFDKLTILAGAEIVGCEIINPQNNPCYFVAVVSLEDGTELYRSGLIAPGKAIYSMTLSKLLPVGSYPATLTYHCYSLDGNRTELNGAVTHFILEVKQ